jgi:hypothetical protein
MASITIASRFRGPPSSGNGGYVCGLLAQHVGTDGAEITLRLPPPLERALDVVPGADGSIELRDGEKVVANGRRAKVDVGEIPHVGLRQAAEGMRRTRFSDAANHFLPMCFVCGPGRLHGDGLRLFVGPLLDSDGAECSTHVATWVPYGNLVGSDGRVAPEFVWSALDCPTGFAGGWARELGMNGDQPMLLGRMAAEVRARPRPGEECVITAWPVARDGRKLMANAALTGADGNVMAIARATWLVVDRQVQLGKS